MHGVIQRQLSGWLCSERNHWQRQVGSGRHWRGRHFAELILGAKVYGAGDGVVWVQVADEVEGLRLVGDTDVDSMAAVVTYVVPAVSSELISKCLEPFALWLKCR